jgi:hypothetical protein
MALLSNARPRKRAPEQASKPISEVCKFAVYVSSNALATL